MAPFSLCGLVLLVSGLLVSAGSANGGLLAERQGPVPPESQGLHRLMVGAGKLYFGTAIETNNFGDVPYRAISDNRDEFGMYVPENSQKWEAIQPQQGVFAFDAADSILRLARTNGQMFRCHTLTWHSQLPAFVENGTWTRETLTDVIITHITNVMTHYRGLCYAWDVVNEALNENGTFRNSVFFRTLGTDFIPISFRAAAAADPTAKLYYNDFNLETTRAKADGAVRIVRLIQAAGVPIHGIGFQAHFRIGQTPNRTSLIAVQERFTALGLDTTFSELDVAHLALPPNASTIQQQARDYVGVVEACLAVSRCVGITLWQFTDKYSWIPNTFPGLGDACLYDANFTKKPAYTSIARVLAAAATARPTGPARSGGSRVLNVGSASATDVAAVGDGSATVDDGAVVAAAADGGEPAEGETSEGSSSMAMVLGGMLWPVVMAALLVF